MFARSIHTTLAIATFTITAACGSTEVRSEKTTATVARASEADVACTASFRRQRDCTDTFIPGLVDLRVRLDRPAGIAEAARTNGRDAIIAQARQEWASDSTDEAITQTCARMMDQGAGTPEMVQATNACLAESACDRFVPCQLQIIEQHLSR